MIAIAQANALHLPLADDSIDCCVTSPPYWGLRSYAGTGNAQLGLEATPEEFVASMVAVFREVWRVMKPTGTLFLNLGDSYASTPSGNHDAQKDRPRIDGVFHVPTWDTFQKQVEGNQSNKITAGLKPKDLCGIPWRVAFALQADGWWLRSDIIWSKPNPMPESVTDRPTKSHEYIFLLTKRASYYWDQDAVREEADTAEMEYRNKIRQGKQYDVKGPYELNFPTHYNNTSGRNLRTVWQMATQPYSGSHYATYPEELPMRCIKAGSSERGVCPVCGKPWERVVDKTPPGKHETETYDLATHGNGAHKSKHAEPSVTTTVDWRTTCAHDEQPVPATVLDPFVGSGTTLRVAERLGRSGVGFDLSMQYLMENARERLNLAQVRLGI